MAVMSQMKRISEPMPVNEDWSMRLSMPDRGDTDQREVAQYQHWGEYVTGLYQTLFSMIRIDDPDFALANDPKAIEKIRRDAVIQQLITYRKHLVAGRGWTLEPGDDSPDARELARVLQWLLMKAENFSTARFRLAESAFMGLTCEKMIGDIKYLRLPAKVSPRLAGRQLPLWYVKRFKDIDKRRLKKEYIDKKAKYEREYYWTIFNVHRREWRKLSNVGQYIMHTYNDEEDTYGFGRGLNESIFYYWRGKAFVLKYAQQFAESFAKPWIRAKLADLKGHADKLSDRANKWLRLLEKTRGGNVVVGSADDDFDFLQASSQGQQTLMGLIQYFDEALTRLILGSMLAVRTGDNGSRSMGEVHEETTETLIAYDRLILEETLTRSLVKALYEANYSILEEAGLGEAELPRFSLYKDKDPALEVLQQIQMAQAVGMKISKEQAHERTGWKMPSDDEECLEPPQMGMGMPSPEAENDDQPLAESENPDFNSILHGDMEEQEQEEMAGAQQ